MRDVTKMGQWVHNGAFASIQAIVRHNLDPMATVERYDKSQVVMKIDAQQYSELDFIIWQDSHEMARLRGKLGIKPINLSKQRIAALIYFLHSLEDEGSLRGTDVAPD